mmetsp:Transcript_147055/g.270099  ORF Transcript_147055/g.270099 Transcript_147055/m.270099 type:complete len:156 (-) Transcript_147055:181-648(-)
MAGEWLAMTTEMQGIPDTKAGRIAATADLREIKTVRAIAGGCLAAMAATADIREIKTVRPIADGCLAAMIGMTGVPGTLTIEVGSDMAGERRATISMIAEAKGMLMEIRWWKSTDRDPVRVRISLLENRGMEAEAEIEAAVEKIGVGGTGQEVLL